ncbi:MAG: class I SAM-dependent methyltransferase [bacterium]
MLTFDAFQRCETVRHLLNWSLPGPSRLLDVGGYPGRMRSMLPGHEWVICDPRVDSPGGQVRGSAERLPFQDQSFDFAVSLDVLEHIPPDRRAPALDEMLRVSRQGLILSFPHKHPLVEAAERHVRDTYQRFHGKEHPWLSEHALHELPDPQAVADHLLRSGGQVAVFDVGHISRWVYLQMVDVLLEALPGSLDTAQELNRLYEELLYVTEFQTPAYRKIILHLFHAGEPITLALIEPERNEEAKAEIEFHKRVTMGLLDLVNRPEPAPLFKPAVAPLPAMKPAPESKTAPIPGEPLKAAALPAGVDQSTSETKRKDKAPESSLDTANDSAQKDLGKRAASRGPAREDGKKTGQSPEWEAFPEKTPSAKKSGEHKPGSPEPEVWSLDKTELDSYRDYVNRLELGLQAWETTYTDTIHEMTAACRWRSNLEQRRSFKLYKQVLQLLGQKIDG